MSLVRDIRKEPDMEISDDGSQARRGLLRIQSVRIIRLCSRHTGWLPIQLKVSEAVAGLTRRVKLATYVGERLQDVAKAG